MSASDLLGPPRREFVERSRLRKSTGNLAGSGADRVHGVAECGSFFPAAVLSLTMMTPGGLVRRGVLDLGHEGRVRAVLVGGRGRVEPLVACRGRSAACGGA